MRMLMKVSIPVTAGNKGVKEGVLPRTVMQFVEQYKPEGTWFTAQNGLRTAFFVFDMKNTNDIPSIAEPFFMNLDATVDLSPVMNLEDMKTGVERAMKQS
jgi:hypothetical protein